MVFLLSPKLPQRLLVAAALVASGASQPAMAASNVVQVLVDQATLVRLDRPAAEIVVGNPSIADVSVQSGKVLVVTGKSFGETNLIVMDADGKVVANRRLIVQEPRAGFVTVYRGGARQTLHCAPNCTPPLVIGDDAGLFRGRSPEADQDQAVDQPILGRRRRSRRRQKRPRQGHALSLGPRYAQLAQGPCAYPRRSPQVGSNDTAGRTLVILTLAGRDPLRR